MTVHLPRLLQTLRYLPPSQVAWRIQRRLFPKRPGSPLDQPGLVAAYGRWEVPIPKPRLFIQPRVLRLLGEDVEIDREGWSAPDRSALVRYNLHYFDCLGATGAGEDHANGSALMHDWIARNPAGTAVAWDPYPISLRLVNWIKFAIRTGVLDEATAASIGHQAQWLAANLERDIRANHLFANGKALAFAGLALGGSETAHWRTEGRALVLAEAEEQQLADGAHFERSPMYHALFAEDLLDLVNLARRAGDTKLADALAPRAAAALAWLEAMCHPDGQIAFFNDAAFGIAPSLAELLAYAERLGIEVDSGVAIGCTEPASGYVRLERGDAVILADIAPVGPDYQPGHAHADTLSFEMSLDGERVIVNSGTSLYGTGPERHRQRGTAAHSTLEIDGENSSDVWAGFRVGRRARASLLHVSRTGVSGSHDGYRFLPGKPVHTRRWQLRDHALVVEDSVRGAKNGEWDAVVRFHLHPAVTLEERAGSVRLSVGSGRSIEVTSSRPIVVIDGTWHPRFGESVSNRHLAISWRASSAEPGCITCLDWSAGQ